MTSTILIARLIGPMLLLTGLIAVFNPRLLTEIGREILAGRALLFLAGILALITGLAIVNSHNVWTGWPVIITLFGWVAIAAGISRMAFPGLMQALGDRMLGNMSAIRFAGLAQIALGGFLAYQGYF